MNIKKRITNKLKIIFFYSDINSRNHTAQDISPTHVVDEVLGLAVVEVVGVGENGSEIVRDDLQKPLLDAFVQAVHTPVLFQLRL